MGIDNPFARDDINHMSVQLSHKDNVANNIEFVDIPTTTTGGNAHEVQFSESSTGAVRSNDLDKLRWDLIPYSFIFDIVHDFNGGIYGPGCTQNKEELIVEAIGSIYEFLIGGTNIKPLNNAVCTLVSALGLQEDESINIYRALRPLASTLAHGYEKYGAWNWLKGFPIEEILNHALDHLFKLLGNEQTGEDDAGHALCNLCFAIHFLATNRTDLMNGLLGPNYTITDELEKRMKDKRLEQLKNGKRNVALDKPSRPPVK